MPHIHKLYDFVTSVFIVNRDAVLMVNHKKYNRWLPIGGHIEMNEDPEQGLYREIQEECGLKVKILADKPKIRHKGVKPILTPSYVDCHDINKTHKHIAFVYYGISRSRKVVLHTREHRDFHWFTHADIHDKRYALTKSLKFYCLDAFERAKNT
ncbi:MAG: ADP-ribose pyrophosphatase YjhB (NUDIX family) [Candidatus Omnitrophota bacterium]|jgi:ADP-ribose pyrophosphatase YjhB (NUDIX family)